MKVSADKISFTTFKDDARIFKAGRFLRKYKIDELAQLFNVFKADMAIVGPRPTVLEDYNKMTLEQKKRSDILPGLTGLAQISGNTSLKWPERIKFDLEYIQKKNLISIIFKHKYKQEYTPSLDFSKKGEIQEKETTEEETPQKKRIVQMYSEANVYYADPYDLETTNEKKRNEEAGGETRMVGASHLEDK